MTRLPRSVRRSLAGAKRFSSRPRLSARAHLRPAPCASECAEGAAVDGWFDEIAERAARSGNQHGSTVGRRRALAVDPAAAVERFHEVVAHVEDRFGGGREAEAIEDAMGDQASIGAGPMDGVIVPAKILDGVGRRSRAVAINMVAKNGFAEAARTAVDGEQNGVVVEVEAGESGGVFHAFDRLKLGEMIAAADGAERMFVTGGHGARGAKPIVDVTLPRVVEVGETIGPGVEFRTLGGEGGVPEADAAADVVTDEGGIDSIGSDERGRRWGRCDRGGGRADRQRGAFRGVARSFRVVGRRCRRARWPAMR